MPNVATAAPSWVAGPAGFAGFAGETSNGRFATTANPKEPTRATHSDPAFKGWIGAMPSVQPDADAQAAFIARSKALAPEFRTELLLP